MPSGERRRSSMVDAADRSLERGIGGRLVLVRCLLVCLFLSLLLEFWRTCWLMPQNEHRGVGTVQMFNVARDSDL
jgi:hypothetical protein